MPVLYLVEQGATLRKEGDTFLVTKDNSTLQEVPASKVDQVVIFGNINITTPVIHYLLMQGIDCAFCSSNGKYHGRLLSTESRFGLMRQAQLQASLNPEIRLAVARQVVRGKLSNYRTMLMRYARERDDTVLQPAVGAIEDALEKLDGADDIGAAMGLEGASSLMYFNAFQSLLKYDLGFRARVKRPPRDPVNSLLSFGYTLLTYDTQAAVRIVGLDPFLGFLHSVEYSKPSLALDLMEEFRPLIVDSIVLRAINQPTLTSNDFQKREEEGMVLLRQEAIKKFLGLYEERMLTEILHPRLNTRATYRRSIELQARQLARVINGQEREYQPFMVK